MKKCNRSSIRLEILRVNRFSSELAHRHIIVLLLLVKLMIISPKVVIGQATRKLLYIGVRNKYNCPFTSCKTDDYQS